MSTRKPRGLPAQLESTRRQFERWRQKRTLGTRIPESLWDEAVKLAGIYGVWRTASTLRVDYYSLKRRLKRSAPAAASAAQDEKPENAPTFVELPAPLTSTSECIVELENAEGAKMRVHLKGVASPDLAALSRSFWGVES